MFPEFDARKSAVPGAPALTRRSKPSLIPIHFAGFVSWPTIFLALSLRPHSPVCAPRGGPATCLKKAAAESFRREGGSNSRRSGPVTAPVLSEELRRRMQDAVKPSVARRKASRITTRQAVPNGTSGLTGHEAVDSAVVGSIGLMVASQAVNGQGTEPRPPPSGEPAEAHSAITCESG